MDNPSSYNSGRNWYKLFSVAMITGFGFLIIVGALLTPTKPIGESDDYMLSAISLQNRFSLFILPSDIAQAKQDFPEHDWYWTNYNLHATMQPGVFHSYYFGTYSLSCIPMKILLKKFGLSQSYAFSLTNAILYILALLFVFFRLRQSDKNIFLVLLLLVCNPALFYIAWPSAEIFIFALVVMSLVCFSNNEHRKAAFFISLAASVQPTLNVLGLVILIGYLLFRQAGEKERKKPGIREVVRDLVIKTGKFSICYFPAFVPVIYTLVNFRTISLNMFGNFSDYWYRYVSYLFDLNFGLLPYFQVGLVLFFILAIIGLYKLNRGAWLFATGFFGVMAAYSVAYHINCGMTGIARYNIWVFPIAIFFMVSHYDVLVKSKSAKRIIVLLLIVSSALSLAVIKSYGTFTCTTNYTYMTPIARKVLDNYPWLYNPYHYTFVSRVKHMDGGYLYKEPVIYYSTDGLVKKILVTPGSVSEVRKMVYGNEEDMKFLQNETARIKNGKGFCYIDFNKSRTVKVNYFPKGKLCIKATKHRVQTQVGLWSPDRTSLSTSGKPGYLAIGPDLNLKACRYKLTATGKLVGLVGLLGAIEVVSFSRGKVFAGKEIFNTFNPTDSTFTSMDFSLEEDVHDASFRIFVNDRVYGCFTGFELRRIGETRTSGTTQRDE